MCRDGCVETGREGLRPVAGRGRRKTLETVRTWGSTTNAILALREHLINEQVSLVVMEATGDYWKPFYYLLEDADFEVMLVNARHVKNLPGRKSDVSDAAWLAQLGAHGLVRGSFVPPAPIRQLRDLTRARTAMTRERGREIQRLEKLLELSRSGSPCPDRSGPFPQTARRTRRAPLRATSSPRNLPLCERQRPRRRDVPSVAVSGDRNRFEVDNAFPSADKSTGHRAGEPSSRSVHFQWCRVISHRPPDATRSEQESRSVFADA